MVKIASNVAFFGPLRDIRISEFKPYHNGNGSHSNGKQNGNGSSAHALPEQERPTSSLEEPKLSSELAEKKLEEMLQAREKAGHERGRREAEQAFASQIETLRSELDSEHRAQVIGALEALNGKVHEQMAETCKSLEKHLVNLAAEAAIKLVCDLPISTEMVEAYVRTAVAKVEQNSEITVLLHPEDLGLLEEHKSSLLNRAGSFPAVRFRPDPKLSRGGCLVETRFGEIDARRETRIELLKKAVNE